MKLHKVLAMGGVLAHLLCMAPVMADEDDDDCCPDGGAYPMRITARHIEGKGIGYSQGYTTLEAFFSMCDEECNWVFFIDARGHVFDNGRPAANGGIGGRYLTDTRAWGINAYYDYRNTKRVNYNQAALGLETLGSVWDFRINGYLPFGKTKSGGYDLDFVGFSGNEAIVSQKSQYAMGGVNAEVAAHVDVWENYPMYFAAGPYYLARGSKNAWGGQVRAVLNVYDYVQIDGNVSYDNVFKWIGQGQIGITIPFGGKKLVRKDEVLCCSEATTLSRRAFQPVDRFEIIPVHHKTTKSAAVNPSTRDPYNFIFVDNTSSSAGTYESPYATLATAELNSAPTDIIYIFPGDGTTTGLDAGITLQDYQWLWGSGIEQTLPTTLGTVAIPAMSSGTFEGVLVSPMITNASGPVVVLGNGNQISGLFLQNQGSNYCISASGITDGTILDSTLAAANAAGYIGVNGDNLSGTLTFSGCTFNQTDQSINLTNSQGSLTAQVLDSTFSNTNSAFAAIQWGLSGAAQGTLLVQDSTIISTGAGIEFDMSGTSVITTQIIDNTIASAEGAIYFNSIGGNPEMNGILTGNQMSSYYQTVYCIQTGSVSLNLQDNILASIDFYPFELDSNAGSTNATIISKNNIYSAPVDYGVYLNQSAGNVTASFSNDTINSSDEEYSIYSYMNTDAISQTLSVTDSVLNGGEYGIYFNQTVGTSNTTITGSYITIGYDECCLYWDVTGAANATLNMTDNIIQGYYGFYIDQDSTGNVDIVCNQNTITSDYPLYFSITEGSTTIAAAENTLIGYYTEILQSGGALDATFTNNSMTGAGSEAFFYNGGAGVNATLSLTENTIFAGGYSTGAGAAINLDLTDVGTVNTTINDNILNGVVAGAYVFFRGGTHIMDLSNNIMTSGGGYTLSATSGSAMWNVNGNSFAALSSTPVSAIASGAANVCMQLNNNTAYPTVGAYVLDNSGTGTFTLNPPSGNIGQVSTTNVVTAVCP